MKPIRVLVAGHDLGGINLLVPLLRQWGTGTQIKAEFLSAPVPRRDVGQLIPDLAMVDGSTDLTEQMCHRRNELDRFLSKVLMAGNYDAVVCGTSANALLERRLFLAARAAGVPSVAFCDMWWAYAERFHDGESWTLPDRLWVIDDTMRDAVMQVHWPRPLPVDVVGSPLFGDLARRRQAHDGVRGEAIRFISEPASTKFPDAGIDEFALGDTLIAAVRAAGSRAPVVVRPHPADSQEGWRRWVYARRHHGASMETLPIEAAISDTARAVGVSSILLTEMRMCGVPVASIQPKEADPLYYCLPFEALGITRVRGKDDLAAWLSSPVDGTPPAAAAIHLNATDNAARLLIELAATEPATVP